MPSFVSFSFGVFFLNCMMPFSNLSYVVVFYNCIFILKFNKIKCLDEEQILNCRFFGTNFCEEFSNRPTLSGWDNSLWFSVHSKVQFMIIAIGRVACRFKRRIYAPEVCRIIRNYVREDLVLGHVDHPVYSFSEVPQEGRRLLG